MPRVSAVTKMVDDPNVIHIIGGDEADKQNDKPVASTGCDHGQGSDAAVNFTRRGDGAMFSESFQFPTYASSSRMAREINRSHKNRYCRQYYSEVGCPFGDNCVYIHDEQTKTRESLAIVLGPGSSGGYRNGVAIRNDGGLAAPSLLALRTQAPPILAPPAQAPPVLAPPVLAPPSLAPQPLAPPVPAPSPLPARLLAATTTPPLAPLPLAQTMPNSSMKPLNWRTKICNRWELSGYCQYGSRCFFAHGEAELQRFGGGPICRDANPNSQWVMAPNLAAASGPSAARAMTASGPSAAHAITASGPSAVHAMTASGSSAAHAGDSGQISGAVQRPIPSWKVPKKINRIYGDWIDDDE